MGTLSWLNIFSNNLYKEIYSPLAQFEIRDLLSIDLPVMFDIHLSLTNIGVYIIIGGLLTLVINIFSTNKNKLVSNPWLISQEVLYATIHSIVISQINPKSGQSYFPFIYALFLFILINNLVGMVSRRLVINIFIFNTLCCIKYKNMVRTYFVNTSTSHTSTSLPIPGNKNSYYLHPYYITGFVDGEGCFSISIYQDSKMSTGWHVKPVFKISLHNKDKKILEAIQRTFGVGKIYKHGKDSSEYRVSSFKNLRVILNHFDKYPLITKKLGDYFLFKQSVDFIEKKEHLTKTGLLKLVSIKAALNWGLSEKFKESFPNVIPVVKPEIKPTKIKNTNWIRGFVEAEGSFQIVIQKSKDKTRELVSLKFSVCQHSRDSVLLESFVNYLGCGRYYPVSKRNEVYFIVSVFSDINNKIIPLFKEYPLIGNKKEDYLDFVKTAEIIKSKDHLTNEGIEKIKIIKDNMNNKRIPDKESNSRSPIS